MHLIVGLGNPGPRYAGTRHNLGYAVAEELARRHGLQPARVARKSEVMSGFVADKPILVAKPLTYMNLSGEAVAELVGRFEVEPERVLVIADDVALPLGTLRLRLRGSHGGHNGLASVEEHLGTRDYPRLRLGVGGSDQDDLVDFVLSRFEASEREIVQKMVARAADAVTYAIEHGVEAAMSRFNGPLPQEATGEVTS